MTDMFGSELHKGDYVITTVSSCSPTGHMRIGIVFDDAPRITPGTGVEKVDVFLVDPAYKITRRDGLLKFVIAPFCMKVTRDQIRDDIAEYLEVHYVKMDGLRNEAWNV